MKPTFKRLILAFGLVFLIMGSVSAQNYSYLGKDNDGVEVYLDTERIVDLIYTVGCGIKLVFPSVRTLRDGTAYDLVIGEFEIDCETLEGGFVAAKYYRNGALVYEVPYDESNESTFRKFSPTSFGGIIFNRVCK